MTPKLKDLYEIDVELKATRARVKELEDPRPKAQDLPRRRREPV